MSDPVLIVGCGYLGRRVARRLMERGANVIGTTRSAERADDLARLGITPHRLDLTENAHIDTIPPVSRVLLCVGYDRRGTATRRDVGVTGLVRIVSDLAKAGLHRVVYTGSISVYGQTGGEWVDENSPTEPHSEPGRVQVEAETSLRELVSDLKILRLGGIYGPSRVIHRDALIQGEPLRGDPSRWLNLIHVDDAARAVDAALTAETVPSNIINVCDDGPVTRADYAEHAARALGTARPQWSPSPSADEPNRRIRNHRLKADLIDSLTYPTIAEGLPQAVDPGHLQSEGAGSI